MRTHITFIALKGLKSAIRVISHNLQQACHLPDFQGFDSFSLSLLRTLCLPARFYDFTKFKETQRVYDVAIFLGSR